MEYKSIRLVGVFSVFMSALLVLGAAVLAFGWAQPSGPTDWAILMINFLAFSMLGTIAFNVVAILDAQDDHIVALQRQLAEQRSRA